MDNKLFALINKISLAIQDFTAYFVEVGEFKMQIQKTLISVVTLIVLGVVLVLCTWFSILALIFFALLMIPLTYVQAALIVVGVNIILLIGLFFHFNRTKKRVKRIKVSGAMILVNYFLLMLKRHFQG